MRNIVIGKTPELDTNASAKKRGLQKTVFIARDGRKETLVEALGNAAWIKDIDPR